MESASSFKAFSLKFLRGWWEFGRMRSISISRSCSVSSSGVPSNALKPRPRAFLCAMDNLLCQAYVTFGPLGLNVVKQYWPAVAGSLSQPDIARNDRRKQLFAEESPEILADLMREIGALIKHRQ